MNSLENAQLCYKNRSPVANFFTKDQRTTLSRSNIRQSANLMSRGHHSRRFKETKKFDVFPVVKTPPAKRFSKIVNPFEAALSERLHLPIIESPTLFQRPPTPQHSSTQFAWTIDDVSSLQPANVEPHETQFHDSPDPEFEAKAQSAISSYFKEQQIVPSPIDCPLRSQRIVLSDITGNTPISKPGRRIKDNVAQTVLSLPPILPKDLEDALAPYFIFTECQQGTSNLADTSLSAIEYDIRDASLRRKLFDHQGASCMDDETFGETESYVLTVSSPPPQSPEVVKTNTVIIDEAFFNSRLSDPMDKSSFGSLSPIAQSFSPPDKKCKSRFNFPKNGIEYTSRPFFSLYDNYRGPKPEDFTSPLPKKSSMYRFTTPDRNLTGNSSSPYRLASDMSSESAFNIKISGLIVDTTKRTRATAELELFADETQDIDEDEMQVSQLSAISNVSSESDTPRSKRRSASRKNLSQSFTNQPLLYDDEGSRHDDHSESEENEVRVPKHQCTEFNTKTEIAASERSVLYRTDSGFNEMATSCSVQCDAKSYFQINEEEETANKSPPESDISMICCSTPSKHSAIP